MSTSATKTKEEYGQDAKEITAELPKHQQDFPMNAGSGSKALASNSFTTFYTWRGNGVHSKLRFNHSAIRANSRVFVSISEFNSDAAQNRFIGDARMAVYNVAPFNGGFLAWVDVSFDHAINARFDVLVEP